MGDRRRRRRLAALAAAGVLLTTAVGCVEGFTGNEVRSDAPGATAEPADVRAASPVVTDLGARVLGALAARDAGNVAISPSALAVQLSMVAAGAATSSATALDGLLGGVGLTTSTDGRTTLGGAVVVPGDRNGTRRSAERSGPVEVRTAIALWIQRGPALSDTFLDELAIAHSTGVRQLDFRSDPEGARSAINLWTSTATADTTDDVAPPGSVTSTSRLLSTAAQSVEAPWLLPFDSDATEPAPFTTASGAVVDVPTMVLDAPVGLRFGRGDGWQAVGLPYLGRDLMTVVALPEPGAPPLTDRLDARLVTDIVEGLAPRSLSVRLPRFTLDVTTALSGVLGGLGAGVVFDTDLADLTAAAPTERLALTEVLQTVRLGVDEEGSGGRAATVDNPGERPPTPPLEVRVDRPFLLLVVDVPTRIPLLMAEVVDPT